MNWLFKEGEIFDNFKKFALPFLWISRVQKFKSIYPIGSSQVQNLDVHLQTFHIESKKFLDGHQISEYNWSI